MLKKIRITNFHAKIKSEKQGRKFLWKGYVSFADVLSVHRIALPTSAHATFLSLCLKPINWCKHGYTPNTALQCHTHFSRGQLCDIIVFKDLNLRWTFEKSSETDPDLTVNYTIIENYLRLHSNDASAK